MQYHLEVVASVLDVALACGEMNEAERAGYNHQRLTTDVAVVFGLNDHQFRSCFVFFKNTQPYKPRKSIGFLCRQNEWTMQGPSPSPTDLDLYLEYWA